MSRSKNRANRSQDALEKRMQKSKQKQERRGNDIIRGDMDIPLWSPKDGTHIIDIIPYKAGKNDSEMEKGEKTYMFEYYYHKNVGLQNKWIICLAETFGKPCPICEHRQKLRDKGVDKDIWIPLFPKKRNIYNIISYDRGEAKKGVQVWDVSEFYCERNLMAIAYKKDRNGNERRVNFASPKKGKSISFTIEPAKGKDDYPSYVGYSFEDRDYEIKKKYLQEVFTLDEIVVIPDYDEVSEMFFKGNVPGGKKSNDMAEEADNTFEELMDELKNIEDMDELEEFIDENNLNIKIKKKDDEEDVKEKIREALEETYSYNDNNDNNDDDDDDDDDVDDGNDDDDDDDEDDDDDDVDDDNDDDELFEELEDIEDMPELKRFVKKHNVDTTIEKQKSFKYNLKKVKKAIEDDE